MRADGVDGAHGLLDLRELFRRDEIGLVEQHDVGEGDLVLGLAAVLQAQRQVLGIDEGDDRVEFGLGADVVVHEEGLGDGNRVGEAGGLDDDAVEAAGAAHQALDDADQVAAHRAADAAVVHLVDFFVGLDDEVVVDADLAELVDDDGIFLAVVLGEDAVQQRRLAGAEIAGEHGDGDGLLLWRMRRSWEPRRNCGERLGHKGCGRAHIGAWQRQLKWICNSL